MRQPPQCGWSTSEGQSVRNPRLTPYPASSAVQKQVLVLACGALAHEIEALKSLNDWRHLHVKCLDAALHNRPQLIPAKLGQQIARYRDRYRQIFVAYADCGTGGEIDKLLATEGIQRLPGAHCYAVFAGEPTFSQLSSEEPGTFYLTDFLARHFQRLVVKGLGLDSHPELREDYFGNYQRLVYLSQLEDEKNLEAARAAAAFLALAFEHRHCGYGELAVSLRRQLIASA